MNLNAYTLHDVKSLTYSPPFFQVSHGAAVRLLEDLVGDPNTTVGRHPRDFTLYCIGAFDDASGQLLPADVRQHVADAITLVRGQHLQPDLPGMAPAKQPDGVADLTRATAETVQQLRDAFAKGVK